MVVGRKYRGVGGLDLTLYRGVFLYVCDKLCKLLCIWERRSPNVTQGGRGWVGTRLGAHRDDPRPRYARPCVLYPRSAARGERVARDARVVCALRVARVLRDVRVGASSALLP